MQTSISQRGIGLGLLPPGARLLITIGLILYVQYETRLTYVLAFIAVSIALLCLNLSLRFKSLFFSAVIITVVFIFVGNLLFPPDECMDPFDRNCAVEAAIFYSTRRAAMLFFGFAWLNATNVAEMAELTRKALRPISRNYPYDHFGLFLFTIFDRLFFEYEIANFSLAVRTRLELRSGASRFRLRIYVTYLKLSAIILRVFSNTPKIAFAIGMHGNPRKRAIAQLRIEELVAGYIENVEVLKGINLDVKEGDVVLLKGQTGSGKSTLLRVIARYVPRITGYARGTIRLDGEIWLPSEKELIQTLPFVRMVTQDSYAFFLGLTVRQELSFHSEDIEWIATVIGLMGIDDLLDRNISSLSGGQRVKVILSCVLASRAKLLLLDNPLSQLDSEGRDAFIAGLKIYISQVRPIVMVCDRYEQAFSHIANRQIFLQSGHAFVSDVIPTPQPGLGQFAQEPETTPVTPPRLAWQPKSIPLAGLSNATILREGRTVLKHFDFAVFPSEVVALTGANGVGKTTAMLALAGVLPLQFGERFGSEMLGISFQTPELQFVALKTGDELAIKGRLSGAPFEDTQQFCRRELEWVGASAAIEVLDLPPYHSRLLSISSMLQATKVLVIDEPTIEVPLDRINVLNAKIQQLKAGGVSIILITHMPEVIKLCDRVVDIKT